MKSRVLFTAAVVASASAQQDASNKCVESVMTVFALGALMPEMQVCSTDSGVPIELTAYPKDADIAKVVATKSCTVWWDGVVVQVKAISPPCDFPVEGGSVVSTAKFNWGLKDMYAYAKASTGAAANATTVKPVATTTAKPVTTVASSAAAAAASVVVVTLAAFVM
ncbi:hypothetical protein AaE_013459 [Aphanomyces astaci]|uniref:Secreted protein n=1 Tax=Aphanomyces astaci TaxID=112090 RepID=A0A6A4ZHX2_APHAT|nr:hypothetical protein AaE_013459 [Aphanomyces astaci]